MARMLIEVEIDSDPVMNDPHDIAEEIIAVYDLWLDRNHGAPKVEFMAAKWKD